MQNEPTTYWSITFFSAQFPAKSWVVNEEVSSSRLNVINFQSRDFFWNILLPKFLTSFITYFRKLYMYYFVLFLLTTSKQSAVKSNIWVGDRFKNIILKETPDPLNVWNVKLEWEINQDNLKSKHPGEKEEASVDQAWPGDVLSYYH